MSTILIKSLKSLELVSSLQHSAKNVLEMFVIQDTSIWPHLISFYFRFKRNKHKCNFHYSAVLMMSQILKSADFTKTQKPWYLENEALSFLQKKNLLITHQGYFMTKNSFVAEVAFNVIISIFKFEKSNSEVQYWQW